MKPANGSAAQNSEVTTKINALKRILSEKDPAVPATREHLNIAAEKLSLALETPGETVQRVAYYISPHPNLALAQYRVQSPFTRPGR